MIRKGLHIALAFMVLLSSTGFVIHKHYCQNELQNLSLFVEAKTCHSNTSQQKSCPLHDGHQQKKEKKNCCKDITTFLKLDQNQEAQSFEFLIQDVLHLGLMPIPVKIELPFDESFSPHYQNYKPPLLVCDFTVSLQTFLC